MWTKNSFHKISKYIPPSWTNSLDFKPSYRVKLAMLPTPVHKWKLPTPVHKWKLPTPVHKWKLPCSPHGLELFIKRDDMTGNTLGGNKVRKLEFILGKALHEGCKAVITCGGVQSNHCRATAVAAKELGLDCYLFLRAENTSSIIVQHPGNLLLDLFAGSKVTFIPKRMQFKRGIEERQNELAERLLKEGNHKSYCIPIGGSDLVGLYGYIDAWQEMLEQNVIENVDDIFVTCGSGGSAAGLAIANHLTGSQVKIHAVTVSDNKQYFHGHIKETLDGIGLGHLQADTLIDIIDGYKGSGYGETTREDIANIKSISYTTGIFCDPVYTWKGLKGLLTEYETNRARFKGNRVLFIHTGGIFSLYDDKMKQALEESFNNQVL